MKRVKYVATPTLAKFHKSDAFVRGVLGPVGSSKSTGCCWEIWRRAHEMPADASGVRRSRWAVVRNSYRELEDTTIKTWLEWFPEEHVGQMNRQSMTHFIQRALPDGTTLELEVLFRALNRPQDAKKLLSLDLTGAWLNEVREIPKAIFDNVQGRLGRFPRRSEVDDFWFGLICDTNPPDADHWYAKLADFRDRDSERALQKIEAELREQGVIRDDQPLHEFFRQPSGRSKNAENIDNLPAGYYTRLMAGKSSEWIKVYVDGEYGFVLDGKPVYPDFRNQMHVSSKPLEPDDRHPIVVGIDFGLTPAAAFGQRLRSGQVRILRELCATDMGIVRFGEMLRAEIAEHYPGYQFVFVGDPGGARNEVDERTPFDALQTQGFDISPAMTNDPVMRRESLTGPMRRLVDGEPALLIDPSCKMIIKGFSGGFHYKRVAVAGDERYYDKPNKNEYSHPVEAAEYMALAMGEGELAIYGVDPDNEEDEGFDFEYETNRNDFTGY